MGGSAGSEWAEAVANWYFRLNGCLTTVNFVLHPIHSGSQRTDADILAVRFPFRHERDLEDDLPFKAAANRIDVMIAEVKRGECSLNGPWKDHENLGYALGAIGFSPETSEMSTNLTNYGKHLDDRHRIRLFAIGRSTSDRLPDGVVQILWEQVASFIYERFSTNRYMKADHDQWDNYGKKLFALAVEAHTGKTEFERALLLSFDLD
jgi:hypothetical protein